MALIVEDGTIVTGAESYESVANCDTYWAARASDPLFAAWDAGTTAGQEEALRVSTQEVDAENESLWKGDKSTASQSLDWPRFNAFDSSGHAWESNEIPTELTSYLCERAARYMDNIATGMIPDVDAPSGGIQRERIKAGPVELDTTYAGSASPVKSYFKLDVLLNSLIQGGGTAVIRA